MRIAIIFSTLQLIHVEMNTVLLQLEEFQELSLKRERFYHCHHRGHSPHIQNKLKFVHSQLLYTTIVVTSYQ